jgi:tetratricopeptide (TPR) repeat protein
LARERKNCLRILLIIMGITNWLAKKGASGFTSSLLLLYTDAAGAGIKGEKERWESAFSSASFLPVPLSASNKQAFQEILKDWDSRWTDEPTPQEVIEAIVVGEAIIISREFPETGYMAALYKGVQERIESFRNKFPNRAVFLDNPERQKEEKFREFEKSFLGQKEYENNAKATWLVSRGNHYGDKGMLDKALKDFEEALRLQPDHLPAHVSRAMVYVKKGEKEKAEQLLKDMPEEMKVDGRIVGTKRDILDRAGF